MSDHELEIGAQTRAAEHVFSAIEPLETTIKDLATALEGAAGGFKGGSSVALAEAVRAWFTAARELPTTMAAYGAKLIEVDVNSGREETAAREAFARIQGQMGTP